VLELRNETSFPAAMVPGLDTTGLETLTVVVKGTFVWVPGQTTLERAEEQRGILFADEHHGEPSASSVKYEADTGPAKRGTDIVLVGHAVSARPSRVLDVMLTAGPVAGVLRVFGDRAWYRSLGRFEASEPLPFSRMPLVWERAFGGADTSDPDPAKHAYEERNPVGTGFFAGRGHEGIEGTRLPNVEDPRALVSSPMDRPAPAGFAFVARSWMPRRAYAGTYDERWRRERFPFLPEDFDERFFDAAPENLVTPEPLVGLEPVVVTNVSEQGDVRFFVPRVSLGVTLSLKGRLSALLPSLATMVIEPDERRVTLTWRATFPCRRELLYVDYVRIREEASS